MKMILKAIITVIPDQLSYIIICSDLPHIIEKNLGNLKNLRMRVDVYEDTSCNFFENYTWFITTFT